MNETDAAHLLGYVEFGALTSLTRVLEIVHAFPDSTPPEIERWCQIHEAVLHVLEELPTGAEGAIVRTQLIAYVEQRIAYQMGRIGGRRGDLDGRAQELAHQKAAINQGLADLGGRIRADLGLPDDEAPEPGRWLR